MADKKLADGLQRVKEAASAPEHRRTDLSNEAWEVLRAGIVACKKDDGPLNAVANADVVVALDFLCRYAKMKKMLKGRIVECIKIALATETWTLAARKSSKDLKDALQETLGDSGADLLAKLETGEAEPEAAAAGTEEGGEAEAGAEPVKEKEPAMVMMESGRDGMRDFSFEFPHDPLGTKLDEATAAFMVFYDGLSKLGTGHKFELLTADGVNPFENFQENFPDILNFLVSMAEAPSRGSYKSRVKYVVNRLQEYSPVFKEVVVQYGKPLPWEASKGGAPTEDAPTEETPTEETPTEETPAEETPAEETLAEETPADELPAEETPADETPAETAPAEETPTDDIPAAETAAVASEPERVMRPVVVWIDFKSLAFTTSPLNKMEGILFRGFHDDESAETYEDPKIWKQYIVDRAGDSYNRVAVIILNFKYLSFVKEIEAHCRSWGWEVPEFVMVTRQRSPELTAGGIKPNMVTGDWIEAAKLAMTVLKKRYALEFPDMK
eukprot:TRINITY_DN18805_c0_g1_i1.p1 TRINITY_DN18805_c0_g1~~TRINITY_DN18805_c0_g1_i1.p1  ORF type:complete len:551 (+),score=112.84 TRINITY_DN18805_c0_g1_i1:158-1654(+)